MVFDLRITELGSREVRRERRMSKAEHEQHEQREHRERDRDPLDRLPGQMMNIAGAAVVGGVTIGILGTMHK